MDLIPVLKPGIWNAWLYMSVFIIQMIIIMFAGEKIRRRSHVPADIKRSRLERCTAVIANAVWLLALVYSVFLPLKTGTTWFYTGLLVFLGGLVIITLATYHFMKTPPDQIISKGVYRFSRHPMYLATFLICIGAGISTGSWIFLILCLIMILCFHQEALVEEKFCLEKYGNAYLDYMKSVPRWIGLIKRS